MKSLAYFFSGLLLLITSSLPVQANEWQANTEMRARMIASDQRALVEMEFNDGWYTYWRYPGDAGLPLTLTPTENSGIESVTIKWPVPERYEEYGLTSYIYKKRVAIPVEVTYKSDYQENNNYTGDINAFLMICKTVCVPQDFVFNVKIDNDLTNFDALYTFADRKLPHIGNRTGLEIDTAVLSEDALVLAVKVSGGFDQTDVFIDAGPDIAISTKPEIIQDEKDKSRAMIKISKPEYISDLRGELSDKSVTLVLKNRNKSIERVFEF